jgi:magnesium transporter
VSENAPASGSTPVAPHTPDPETPPVTPDPPDSESAPLTPHAWVKARCLHNPAIDQIRSVIQADGFAWIDLEAPDDDDLQELASHIKLHPLTIQDAKTFRQRPKIEDYDDYMYLVVFGVDPGTASGGPLLREVHMIITGEAVVTIHRRPNVALADLREHYDDQHIRSEQFLVYKILDAITSTFIPVLTRIDDDIDDLEQQVINSTSSEQLQRIFSIKRDLVAMRRVITPMRDMFQRSGDKIAELPGLQTDDKLYFRDLYDGLIRVSELVDSYRDLLSGATDMYLSQVANNQGEINKQLTIIATIFLPLSFLTGFFGQNFSFLTNGVINQTWTFWVLGVGLLAVSVAALAIWFKRKGWLGGR